MDEKEAREEKGQETAAAIKNSRGILSRIKKDPIVKFIAKRKDSIFAGILFILVIFFAFFVRINTFWLPHWMGDQSQYVALAMKLDKLGFEFFNLRGLQVGFVDLDKQHQFRLVYPETTENVRDKGQILAGLERAGIFYYNKPFFHKPPGFPYALILSHHLFAKTKDKFMVVFGSKAHYIRHLRPKIFMDTQFWAVIVPLFFSVGSIALTFIIGKMFFSTRVGFYAAFLMSIHPVSVMTAQKLWADDMVMFFIMVALLMFIIAKEQQWKWLNVFAGISCGIAVLAKQTGGYLLIALWGFLVIINLRNMVDMKSFLKIVFSDEIILFGLGLFMITGFWFIKITAIYGRPLWTPISHTIVATDRTGWFRLLRARPQGWVLYTAGIPAMCPLFAIMIVTIKDFIGSLINILNKKVYNYRFILLWLVIFTWYYMLRTTSEHRRMLPVYPSMAILAGYGLYSFKVFMRRFKFIGNPIFMEIIILTLLVACALYSIPIGVETGIENRMLLMIPF